MPEVSRLNAALIIKTSRETIRRAVNNGELPARREGKMLTMWIEVGELKRWAESYNYRFNEELAKQLAK